MPTTIVFNDDQIMLVERKNSQCNSPNRLLKITMIGVPIICLRAQLEDEPDVHKLSSVYEESSDIVRDEIKFLAELQKDIDEVIEKLPYIKKTTEIIEDVLRKYFGADEEAKIRNITVRLGREKITCEYNNTWLYNLLSRYIQKHPLVEKLKQEGKKRQSYLGFIRKKGEEIENEMQFQKITRSLWEFRYH